MSNFVTFELPLDLVRTLAGGVVGLGLVYLVNWLWRPRVKFLGFTKSRANFGTLYKLRFKLKGRSAPGFCGLQIEWSGGNILAKWDETPNPVRGDDPRQFEAALVPATFYQPLFLGREYAVPIVIEHDGRQEIFSGWWFGREMGYGPDPRLPDSDRVRLTILGGGLRWSREFFVVDIGTAS